MSLHNSRSLYTKKALSPSGLLPAGGPGTRQPIHVNQSKTFLQIQNLACFFSILDFRTQKMLYHLLVISPCRLSKNTSQNRCTQKVSTSCEPIQNLAANSKPRVFYLNPVLCTQKSFITIWSSFCRLSKNTSQNWCTRKVSTSCGRHVTGWPWPTRSSTLSFSIGST